MRKTPLVTDEIYHIYNRGTDKRIVFADQSDLDRFFQSMTEFNSIDPIGSIYEAAKKRKNASKNELKTGGHPMSTNSDTVELVEFIAYCLNPNHFHFILRQKTDKGIEKFMQKVGNGYTKYFNHKYKRSGVLFQGKFKSILVDTNEYLLHLSSYVNLNNRSKDTGQIHKYSKSSWDEFTNPNKSRLCKVDIVLDQYKSPDDYMAFAQSSYNDTEMRRVLLQELEPEQSAG